MNQKRSWPGVPKRYSTSLLVRVIRPKSMAVLRIVVRRVVKAIDGDNERQLAFLEVVDRREAVSEPASVGQDHGAERTVGELIPHEPETLLAGSAEEVQHEPAGEGDPAEVHGDSGRGLAVNAAQIVVADALGAQALLWVQWPDLADRADERRVQWPDLADRADERRLARTEPARDEDLVSGERAAGRAVRGRGAHAAPPSAGLRWVARRPVVAAVR